MKPTTRAGEWTPTQSEVNRRATRGAQRKLTALAIVVVVGLFIAYKLINTI